jgi:spermidine synthase
MGATLPIIIKSSRLPTGGLGEHVSFLYATNTAGAIVGALLAGFYLIGGVGINASFRLAATLNVLVGVAAAGVSLALKRSGVEAASNPASGSPSVVEADSHDADISERGRKLVLIIFALSGFGSLALEIIWFRVLVLYFQVTTYAFTIMLATFLFGIAMGSYLIRPFMSRRLNWLAMLAATEVAIGVVTPLSLAVMAFAYVKVAGVETLLSRAPLREAILTIVVSFLAIFPATLLMGIAFPVGVRLWAGDDRHVSAHTSSRIGLFYSVNVFGAIIGSVVAGFLLLRWLGSRGSLILIAAISLVSGLLLLPSLSRGRRRLMLGAGAVGIILFLAAAFIVPDPFAVMLDSRFSGESMLWREEGVQTTVSVHKQPGGTQVMYLNGLHQASDSAGMVEIHRQIGNLPMALHHDPRDVLVIGLGGGVTAGAVSMHSGVEVDIVELSDSVVKGTDWFRHVNYDVVRRPNVYLRVDDGRNYLQLTQKRYDVITADIIQPIHAGAGNLYSVEYFRLVRNALKEDGLILQWIGLRSETQYKMILRTFLTVFPDATLWAEGNLMVGTKRPFQLDPADFERKLRDASTRAALESVGIGSFESLLSLYKAGPEEAQQFVGPGPILTDNRPRIEYFLSLPLGQGQVDLTGVRGDVRRHIKR